MTLGRKTCAGLRLGQIYQLQELVGHGNYSTYLFIKANSTISCRVWRASRLTKNDNVAVKVIPKNVEQEASAVPIEKELLLHKSLAHPNIVKVIEVFEDSENIYLVQELCVGGELLERIEPDVGFPPAVAHFYFVQLLKAIEYLHDRGVAHRDIKPENLLLDENGNLKLTDFGLATLFKKSDKRRTLHTRCGTPLYMAPEVMRGDSYQGDQVDLWSCAVVLFVMLLGCHPWEEPIVRCGHYKKFTFLRQHDYAPWNRLDPACRELLVAMLVENPKQRLNMIQVFAHPWIQQANNLFDHRHLCSNAGLLSLLMQPNISTVDDATGMYALTQPQVHSDCHSFSDRPVRQVNFSGFSQPSSRCNSSSPAATNEDVFSSRLTRFYCQIPFLHILAKIERILDQFLITRKQLPTPNCLSFSTVDRRKNPLTGDIMAIDVNADTTMVVFTKGRGDCLEFKRLFNMVYHKAQEIQ